MNIVTFFLCFEKFPNHLFNISCSCFGECFNTRITAVLTYLELPRAVKMTVRLIKNKMRSNLALRYVISFFLTFVIYLVIT